MNEFYNVFFYFTIYAFFGWCLEVVYQAVEHGKFINRGFLNGPYCPIYGFGAIIVIGALEPLKSDPVILFVGSVILTSALELITGFLLEKIFHLQWWDYSDEKFNIGGYICLKFSLLWGVACLIAVRIIHPAIEAFVAAIPHKLGWVLICMISVDFISDTVVTVLAIANYRKHIILLTENSRQLRSLSDHIGEKLYDTVEEVRRRKAEYDELTAKKRKELEEFRRKHIAALEKKGFNIRRIQNSFPKLKLAEKLNFKDKKN